MRAAEPWSGADPVRLEIPFLPAGSRGGVGDALHHPATHQLAGNSASAMRAAFVPTSSPRPMAALVCARDTRSRMRARRTICCAVVWRRTSRSGSACRCVASPPPFRSPPPR